ncbi:hypothetical protein LCL61_26480 [Amycolatopsis coloradensis]|uniref:Uncharacterized protein n=1 Tax=Amycolatopsis coloradensis TaxID=76021 RepID=A0ACD5BIM5_9PSEU
MTAGMVAALALGAFAVPASAAADTPDGAHWYIGSGNAYGEVRWNDHHEGKDYDQLFLNDDLFPPGYSVKMTVVHDSFEKTVHAKNGATVIVKIPGFANGETAKFKACAWDNGEEVTCRPWTTITE